MPKVTFLSDNKTVTVAAGANLREVCEQQGLSVPFGCGNGICGTCLISIKSGAENVSPKNDHEQETLTMLAAAPEQRLACQCVINGDVTFDLE